MEHTLRWCHSCEVLQFLLLPFCTCRAYWAGENWIEGLVRKVGSFTSWRAWLCVVEEWEGKSLKLKRSCGKESVWKWDCGESKKIECVTLVVDSSFKYILCICSCPSGCRPKNWWKGESNMIDCQTSQWKYDFVQKFVLNDSLSSEFE